MKESSVQFFKIAQAAFNSLQTFYKSASERILRNALSTEQGKRPI